MKTNEFTQGPYLIVPGDNHIMVRVCHEKHVIAIVAGWPGLTKEQLEANKALFASAPELLGELKRASKELKIAARVLADFDLDQPARNCAQRAKEARAAVSRATDKARAQLNQLASWGVKSAVRARDRGGK